MKVVSVLLLMVCECWLFPASSELLDNANCSSSDPDVVRPRPHEWRTKNNRRDDGFPFLEWLIGGCTNFDDSLNCKGPPDRLVEYEGFDGWYNNLGAPSLGAVDTPLHRILPPAYSDGVYQPVKRKVDPLEVSQRLMRGSNGRYSKSAKTAFLVFFGQQVVEEILDAQGRGCPPEYFNMDIDKNHPYRKEQPYLEEIPFHRTRYDKTTGFSPNNPRQQLNEITPYLDGGLVYGTSKGWADVLRLFSNGNLAPKGKLAWHDKLGEDFPAQNTQRLPMANPPPPTNHSQFSKQGYTAPVERFFKLGNPRGNENPFLLTFGILWFRWHNIIAEYLHSKYGDSWSEDRIFNEARKWVIATYQAVVMYDWLPKYMREELPDYEEYNPNINPQISHVFQSAAMRFGHTLVTSGSYLREEDHKGCGTIKPLRLAVTKGSRRVNGVRTCNSYWRSPELFTSNIKNFERFLMGLSSQSCEREDHIIVEDLRERVFGPLEFSRRDLMAINIQRGRDHGLPDYNTARKYFKLRTLMSLDVDEYKNVTKTEVDTDVLKELQALYKDPWQVDIWPGGLLETAKGPGQLFSRIILDQFERIRNADRFWFENEVNELFTAKERCRIRQVKIIDILLSVTGLVAGEDIQEDPFTAVHSENNIGENCREKLSESISCTLLNGSPSTCKYLPQFNNSNNELCSPLDTYDYFADSESSYALTFTLLFATCFGLMLFMDVISRLRAQQVSAAKIRGKVEVTEYSHKAKERVAARETRDVIVVLDSTVKRIQVQNEHGDLLRMFDFTHITEVSIRHLQNFTKIVCRITNHYDLFLIFHDKFYAMKYKEALDKFCDEIGVYKKYSQESNRALYLHVMTVYERNRMLADFSRLVLSNAFNDSKLAWLTSELMSIYHGRSELLFMEITQAELAQQLGMLPDNLFVQRLFQMMDKDKNGFITITEFWDVMVVFAKGSRVKKAQLIFNIYDVSQTGSISSQDLTCIIKSSLSCGGKDQNVAQIVQTILTSVGLREDQSIDFEKFKKIFVQGNSVFERVGIDVDRRLARRRETCFSLYGSFTGSDSTPPSPWAQREYEEERKDILTKEESEERPSINNPIMEHFRAITNHIRRKEQYYFWKILYTMVMNFIFLERAYYYLVEQEHGGLRRVAAVGVAITRGAASAMMFTYSTLLITMCRNILSALRSTKIHRFFPFDEMVEFHRYVGTWALFWTIMHIIGHAINFYHISTQTPADLTCLFRDFFRATHILPKFHYWCWETVTGFTGVLLTVHAAIIYIFAYKARMHLFRWFWTTHNTYPFFYFLMIVHGSGRLVQEPFFHFFFLGPCILFTCDKMVSMSRSKTEIGVISAVHLPSNVILLKIRRPEGFNFLSGQWVRIASLGISEYEYHPFTLSSAPDENDLTLHIRAVGPWTRKIRSIYPDESRMERTEKYPPVYMDGPFGEAHQMWWNFELVIFVAGGIGVTPFSSILKDIAHKIKNSKSLLKTTKIIFLWVTKNQKQFEWMIDALRKVEEVDVNGIIRTHIFITDFKSKYDLRTIMMYLAERHFQKLSGTSLFTGLRAITHFSRPDFELVFKSIKKRYKTSVIGVFSCGTSSMGESVDTACQVLNREDMTVFKHFYEKF